MMLRFIGRSADSPLTQAHKQSPHDLCRGTYQRNIYALSRNRTPAGLQGLSQG